MRDHGGGWVSSQGHRPDGTWSVDGDIIRVGRMRPAGGGAGASWSLALTDGGVGRPLGSFLCLSLFDHIVPGTRLSSMVHTLVRVFDRLD